MPEPIRVCLQPESLSRISALATRRMEDSRCMGLVDRRIDRKHTPKATDMIGLAAEYAVTRWLGLPWDWDHPARLKEKDVPGWGEVRSAWRSDHRLLLKDKPEDRKHLDRPFALVTLTMPSSDRRPDPDIETVTRLPMFISGWAYGHEVAKPGNWRANMPEPCWAMAVSDLHPMETAKNLIRASPHTVET